MVLDQSVKKAMAQLLGRKYRQGFRVLGGKGDSREEKGVLPCFGGRRMQESGEISGGAVACGHYYRLVVKVFGMG